MFVLWWSEFTLSLKFDAAYINADKSTVETDRGLKVENTNLVDIKYRYLFGSAEVSYFYT